MGRDRNERTTLACAPSRLGEPLAEPGGRQAERALGRTRLAAASWRLCRLGRAQVTLSLQQQSSPTVGEVLAATGPYATRPFAGRNVLPFARQRDEIGRAGGACRCGFVGSARYVPCGRRACQKSIYISLWQCGSHEAINSKGCQTSPPCGNDLAASKQRWVQGFRSRSREGCQTATLFR